MRDGTVEDPGDRGDQYDSREEGEQLRPGGKNTQGDDQYRGTGGWMIAPNEPEDQRHQPKGGGRFDRPSPRHSRDRRRWRVNEVGRSQTKPANNDGHDVADQSVPGARRSSERLFKREVESRAKA